MKLSKFVDWWNSECPLESTSEAAALYVGGESAASFRRQTNRQDKGGLRASSLGKPAILQALGLLGYKDTMETSLKQKWTFSLGDYAEAFIMTLMHELGYEVVGSQEEIDFCGVKGHIDGIVDDVLIDVKTMSDYYYKSFTQRPDNDRGYITQLSIYKYCLDIKHASFICLNKNSGELCEVKLPYDNETIYELQELVPRLQQVETLHDALQFEVPRGVKEKAANHRIVVPPSMKYSSFRHSFYELKKIGYKEIIVRYRDEDEITNILEAA